MPDLAGIERLRYLSGRLADLVKAPLPESITWQASLQSVIGEIAKFQETSV